MGGQPRTAGDARSRACPDHALVMVSTTGLSSHRFSVTGWRIHSVTRKKNGGNIVLFRELSVIVYIVSAQDGALSHPHAVVPWQ